MSDSKFIIKLKSIIGNVFAEIFNISNKSNFPLTMVLNDKFFENSTNENIMK